MTKPKPAEPALFVDGVPEEPSAPKTKRKHEVAKVEHLPPPPPANMLAARCQSPDEGFRRRPPHLPLQRAFAVARRKVGRRRRR